ncbi:helix-turn-helix domain-containing protein [Paracoccus versutus]
MIHPDTKGLFRAALVGPGSTIRTAFEIIAQSPGNHLRRIDSRWNIAFTRVDPPPDEGTGCWKLISIGDEIYMIVTDCDYVSTRFEMVPSEGLVEFHFLLEGPVELAMPRPEEPGLTASTIMACHQAPGVSYDVCCLPGRFRMISLYVRPELLAVSFGFGAQPGSRAERLMRPAAGAMALVEAATTVKIVTALRDVFALEFNSRRDLMMVVARIFELLSLTTAALEADPVDSNSGIAFTERGLAMFARAQQILSDDAGGRLTIADLARELGTNSTKMLADPDIPIAPIAHMVGYDHQASFTTAFKTHFGLPPKEVRKLAAPSGIGADTQA